LAALSSQAGEVLAAATQTASEASGGNTDSKRQRNLRRVAISTWSFHNNFESTRDKDEKIHGTTLEMIDFPEMIADRYHVHKMEFVAPHFAATTSAYLNDVKLRLAKVHSHLVNIPVDIEEIRNQGGLSDINQEIRNQAIQGAMKWIDIAKVLGAESVRCDPGKINVKDLSPTVASYKKIGDYARSKGLKVIIENHDAIGSNHPEVLVDLFKQVGNNLVGALPDFGNFPDDRTRFRGLPILFPYASTVCHAKGFKFNAAGDETTFDFPRCVAISKKTNFRGAYSIEYEQKGGDPYEGVGKVVNELVTYL
jgi:hypothetical protein